MELRMYSYRLYPSRKQKQMLFHNLDVCKQTYNELLEANIFAYKETGKGLFKYDFDKFLAGRANGVHSQVLQNVSDRVHKAFANFFRRVKDPSCTKKGFPRFKSRVMSITYPQSGFKFVSDKRLFCSKIGNVPIILHRIPKGKIKTLTIKRNNAGQWFAIFSCEVENPSVEHPHKDKSVGIDVGLTNFATLSSGTSIPTPHFLLKSERRLKRLQRRLSRKKKGSRNRGKARFKVARCHIKIANQRSDFLHKLSRSLTLQFGRIAVEDLNVKGMMSNHCLAKHIGDASWGSFLKMLQYKAVTSGGAFVENPKTRGSSQRCSKCGKKEVMPLGRKTFTCSACGFVEHRDVNASYNHLNSTVGLTGISTPVDIEPLSPVTGRASSMVEAGTTYGKKLRSSIPLEAHTL